MCSKCRGAMLSARRGRDDENSVRDSGCARDFRCRLTDWLASGGGRLGEPLSSCDDAARLLVQRNEQPEQRRGRGSERYVPTHGRHLARPIQLVTECGEAGAGQGSQTQAGLRSLRRPVPLIDPGGRLETFCRSRLSGCRERCRCRYRFEPEDQAFSYSQAEPNPASGRGSNSRAG